MRVHHLLPRQERPEQVALELPKEQEVLWRPLTVVVEDVLSREDECLTT